MNYNFEYLDIVLLALFAGFIIALSSWLAGQYPKIAGFIIALPLASLLAVIFSMIVLIGFDFFFKPKRESSEQKTNNQNQFIEKSDSDIPTINKKDFSEEKSNLKEERIEFTSKRLKGSINLYGATFDDLTLLDYYEKVGKKYDFFHKVGKLK